MKKIILIILMILILAGTASAGGVFISGHVTKGVAAAGPYSTWNEASESGLNDVSFVCLMENTVASGDETAVSPNGVLSGASLTMTAVGDPDAMSGGTRYFDGNDGLIFAGGAIPVAISGTSDFTIIMKVKTYPVLDTTGYWFAAYDGVDDRIYIDNNGSAALRIIVNDEDNVEEALTTANNMLADTEYYLVLVTDTANGITWGGFMTGGSGSGANGQPTKGSDFVSGNTVEFTAVFDNIHSDMGNLYRGLMITAGVGIQGYLGYILLDDSVLIDTAQ